MGLRVLDVNCGAGEGSRLLARWGARAVIGIDPEWEAIRQASAQDNAPRIEFRQCDPSVPGLAEELGLFDLVICNGGIGASESPLDVVRSLAAAVAPGGGLIVSFPCKGDGHTWDERGLLDLTGPVLGPPNQVLVGFPLAGTAIFDASSAMPGGAACDAQLIGMAGEPEFLVATWGTAFPPTATLAATKVTPAPSGKGWLGRLLRR